MVASPSLDPAVSPSPERMRLLARVTDHILTHGIAHLSLSSLARAIGSNNRMLLYYFGSKEQLLDEAWLVVMDRYPLLRDRLRDIPPGATAADVLERAWLTLADPANRPELHLFFEFFPVKARDGEDAAVFVRRIEREWVDEVAGLLRADGVGEDAARESAVAIVALWRGLQIALLAGADPEGLLAAHRRALASLLALETTS